MTHNLCFNKKKYDDSLKSNCQVKYRYSKCILTLFWLSKVKHIVCSVRTLLQYFTTPYYRCHTFIASAKWDSQHRHTQPAGCIILVDFPVSICLLYIFRFVIDFFQWLWQWQLILFIFSGSMTEVNWNLQRWNVRVSDILISFCHWTKKMMEMSWYCHSH